VFQEFLRNKTRIINAFCSFNRMPNYEQLHNFQQITGNERSNNYWFPGSAVLKLPANVLEESLLRTGDLQ